MTQRVNEPTATKRPRKVIRFIEQVFASRAGAWAVEDLRRLAECSESSVRYALQQLARDGRVERLSRRTWISTVEFADLTAQREAPVAAPAPSTDRIPRDRVGLSPLVDDLEKVERRWARLMEARRFEDVPRIRVLPLWRRAPDTQVRSITGSAAAMCAEARASLVGR